MTNQDVYQLVALLDVAFPSNKRNDDTRKLYCDKLVRYDYEVVKAAIDELIEESKFYPKLAEILEVMRRRKVDKLADEDLLPVLSKDDLAANGRRLALFNAWMAKAVPERRDWRLLVADMGCASHLPDPERAELARLTQKPAAASAG